MSAALFFERQHKGQRALLLNVTRPAEAAAGRRDRDNEFAALALAAGCEILATVRSSPRQLNAASLVGAGKVEELAALRAAHEADVLLVDHALTPVQERNMERAVGCRVIDRAALILDLFAQRARSFEGKLQVELAQLRHLSTRLIGGWRHLERQRGGIGLRGPGETQLETDRRLIARRVRQLERRLEHVSRVRHEGRRARRRAGLPIVALVGYTNAGKSTLFNRLTGAGVEAADRLFETLDTTLRKAHVPVAGEWILSDTVGFISDLPHELISAFRATLDEARDADLLLHVVDRSAPDWRERAADVETVLAEIGIEHLPRLVVHNKIDRLDLAPEIVRDVDGTPLAVRMSAAYDADLSPLGRALGERLGGLTIDRWIKVPYAAARLRARLFALGAVAAEQAQDGASRLHVHLSSRHARELSRLPGIDGMTARGQLLAGRGP